HAQRREDRRVLELRRHVEGHGQQRGGRGDRLQHLGPGEGGRDLAARHRLSADAGRRQGRLGAAAQDRPLLLSPQVDLRRGRPPRRLDGAAGLSLSHLHGLRFAAGRSRLQHHQGDDCRLRRLQGCRPRRHRPCTRAPELHLGAPLSRGCRAGPRGGRCLEARAPGPQRQAGQASGDAGQGLGRLPEDQPAGRQGCLRQGLDGGAQGRTDRRRHGPGVRIGRRRSGSRAPPAGRSSAAGGLEAGGGRAAKQAPQRAACKKGRSVSANNAQSAGPPAAPPAKVEFADPHATAGPVEGEVTRVRRLSGVWRWLLILATAATIFLCINQQFTLRFFVGFTQLNTEYYYLLIVCMLPFTFLIFPGSEKAPLDRVAWYDVVLFVATLGSGIYLMLNVRKAAELGWEFGGAPLPVIAAGLVMWVLLMEALRRTGGWSLLWSVLPFTVYPLFAEAGWLGPLKGNQSTVEQATAYHVLSGESLLGIPIQAFAETVIGFLVFGTALMMTGAGKFFINLAFALCGTFRGGAAKVGIFASGLLGMMSGSVVSNVLTAGTMTIPTMKRTGFTASYAGAIEACASTGAVLAPPVMGATAFVIAQFLNISYAEVAVAAIIPAALYYLALFSQVDAYAARNGLKGLPRAELPSAWETLKEGW